MPGTIIEAAELVSGKRELSRYMENEPRLTRIEGRLSDVRTSQTVGVLIFVRNITRLPSHVLAMAEMANPSPKTDELLSGIGVDGAITLVGMAKRVVGDTTGVDMEPVHSINGTDVR